MNQYYYQREGGNFGDDLNMPIFGPVVEAFSGFSDIDWLVGIGTVLDGRIGQLSGTKLILGSGLRPPGMLRKDRIGAYVAALRGPLTASALGVPSRFVFSDPGVLAPRIICGSRQVTGDVAFIPHYHSLRVIDCEKLAARAGLRLIRPDQDPDVVIRAIASCDRVVTEAMHGAIVADALGVPWARLRLIASRFEGGGVSEFKWADWAGGLGIPHEKATHCLPVVPPPPRGAGLLGTALRGLNAARLVRGLREISNGSGFLTSERLRMQVEVSRWDELLGRMIEGHGIVFCLESAAVEVMHCD